MEIRRALSRGANWSVALSEIPALLEFIDEQQIPVDICLTHGTGRVLLRAESVYCRRSGGNLKLEGSGNLVEIDLERVAEARAVSRAAGAKRRISLQLLGQEGAARLTITGPVPGEGHAAQVWHLVMESLLPAIPALRSFKAPVSPVPANADEAQEFCLRFQRLRACRSQGARGEDLPAGDLVALARLY
jgi:hypothetical protein